MNPNGAGGKLVAVTDQVVHVGPYIPGVLFHAIQIAGLRHGEHMVSGVPLLFLGVPLEERKIDDPGEAEELLVDQSEVTAQTQSNGPQGGTGGLPVRRDEEEQVSLFGTETS